MARSSGPEKLLWSNGFAVVPAPRTMTPAPCALSPPIHTSSGPDAQTVHRVGASPTSELFQDDPSQCATKPEPPLSVPPLKSTPTVQTSVDAVAQTARRPTPSLDWTIDHACPSQWSTLPSSPVAHTSCGPVPERPVRFSVVPLVKGAQAWPSKWRIVPLLPTVHTSLALRAQTARKPTAFATASVSAAASSPASAGKACAPEPPSLPPASVGAACTPARAPHPRGTMAANVANVATSP